MFIRCVKLDNILVELVSQNPLYIILFIWNKLLSHCIFGKIFDWRFVTGIKKYWTFLDIPVCIVHEVFHFECIIVRKTEMINLVKASKILIKVWDLNTYFNTYIKSYYINRDFNTNKDGKDRSKMFIFF